ncbi:AAA family ATPase [Marinomonas posidonica]|uniref:Magnesium chelatase n=1 Tax=Marinomonas posidonica (strain CECT 7376 / NCIMB 14433 / IVIA-Po-181) TaxID=491952 RepID=F6CST6_MARPP|nr:AAA family ATPase [Marinomonas posidonica]AEF53926.1 Magnesium chelatase [Marinomonas posidonica IVIA-Po-181]
MIPNTTPDFPFTAIAGQELLKLALTLNAVNPLIGGVLISGPRGSAKSTLARGLAGVMPALLSDAPVPFATLPLGTSEDRLLGALDLEQVLQDKQVAFKPGLLSQAHGGVLYVDEVNLLADHLVDQLLDVAASGINRIERDGVSHQHESKFLLVGTMNPDEGELRPQLKDRFGFMVTLTNQYSLEERVQIVRLRDEFDLDPSAFCDAFKYKQRNLKNSIRLARQKLTQVRCSDAMRMAIAEHCQQANIDGVRGDIVWVRAAMAHAAWRGDEQVSLEDVTVVAELVLAHRRHLSSPNPPASQPPGAQPPEPSRRPDSSKSPAELDAEQSASPQEGDWGAMTPESMRSESSIQLNLAGQLSSPVDAPKKSLREVTPGKHKGQQQGGYRLDASVSGEGIDWFRSLLSQPQQWPPQELKSKAAQTGQPMLHLILLDTSASTLEQAMFAKAKGVILDIAQQAYIAREQIAILGFGQQGVSSILPKVRAPKDILAVLDDIPAGGGTPFRQVLEKAQAYLQQQHQLTSGLRSQTYLLTDGRTQANVSDLILAGDVALIDTESSAIKRGRGKVIAQAINAQYVPLNTLFETSL